jgi:hypothetical protein
MGEERKVYKVLVAKSEGKRPLEIPSCRWENRIRIDLGEIGWGGCGLDSTGSGQGPVAGCCKCGDEPLGSCAMELVFQTCNAGITMVQKKEKEAQKPIPITNFFKVLISKFTLC